MLTGERFGEEEAHRIGLLHGVADSHNALDDLIEAIVIDLQSGGPEAIATTKSLIQTVAGQTITEELRQMTARIIAERRASNEGKDGISAFLDRTNPPWRRK